MLISQNRATKGLRISKLIKRIGSEAILSTKMPKIRFNRQKMHKTSPGSTKLPVDSTKIPAKLTKLTAESTNTV